MNGEGTSSSNSSSKKRSKQLIQCRACNCFMLSKDIDKHQKLNESTTNLSESSIQLETPKQVIQKRVNKISNTRNNKRPSSTGNYNCNNSGFINTQIALIEPNNGMTLQVRSLNNLKDETDWEKNFPMEMFGWQRRHSALVNPEMLSTICAPPRSAFAIISDDETPFTVDVVVLWPCSEIPLMQIAFPPTFIIQQTFDSSLARLQLIQSSGQPLNNILLKPEISKNETTLQEWSKLSKLDYFNYFIKCYFGNALFLINSNSTQIIYYGRKLNFKIIFKEEEKEYDEDTDIERKMKSLCKIEDESETINSSIYYPTVHRVSHLCKFKIDWNEILQLEANKDEKKNQGFSDVDDPDCLL
ncbi:hypothetical protein ACQ4LE_006718 [Meloidogyne hapla]|uniref:Uncharacterized protein n=1 Tax=Meloidogyne hapla TaxID=6305 RepID=A0A1I8BLR1_MELHA